MKTLTALLLTIAVAPAFAGGSTYVKPHFQKDGTFVQGHQRTNPDATQYNNWSTKGNTNPYTFKPGTVEPAPAFSWKPQPVKQPTTNWWVAPTQDE
jgi:hypothetical protein